MIVVSAQPLPRSLQELLLLLHSSLSDSSLRFLTSPACFRQASLAALPPSPSLAVARALQSLLFHTFSLPPCLPTNATRVLVVADEIDESFLAALRELDVPVERATENASLERLAAATARATVVVTLGEEAPAVMMAPGAALVAFGGKESAVRGVVAAPAAESAEGVARTVEDVLRNTLLA